MRVGDVRLVGKPNQACPVFAEEVDQRAADEGIAAGDEGAHYAASVERVGRGSSLNTRRRLPRARSAAS